MARLGLWASDYSEVQENNDNPHLYITPLKTNMDTKNDVFLNVSPFNMAILGLHVSFRGCNTQRIHGNGTFTYMNG